MESLTEDRSGLTLLVILAVVVLMIGAAAFLFIRLLTKYRLVHGQFMPFGAKAAFWLAIAYTVLPIDLLPDPLLFDDIGVLIAALTYINHLRNQLAGGDGGPGDGGFGDGDGRTIIDVDEV